MKRSILLIVVVLFFMAKEMFAGSIVTQRVLNVHRYLKGSTTLFFSGQLSEEAMAEVASGESMGVYNCLDSYLVFPSSFPKTKSGLGLNYNSKVVSIGFKNGKAKWSEKYLTNHFVFAIGNEFIKPENSKINSTGKLNPEGLTNLFGKKLTILDTRENSLDEHFLAGLIFAPLSNGKFFRYNCKENDVKAKVLINSKGKVNAQFKLSQEVASLASLEHEDVFTNKYNYSLRVIGLGNVKANYTGPDRILLCVTENVDKFRYFSYNGIRITNDFLTLELVADTEVLAVFGTYDFSLNVVGNGSANAEFVGPDEVEVNVTDKISKFRYFTANGQKCKDREMSLSLKNDTSVEAFFGTYDFSLNVVGDGSVNVEFIELDKVEIKVLKGGARLRYFTLNGKKHVGSEMLLPLQEDLFVEAFFGTYIFSVNIIGKGSVSVEFIGLDEVKINISEDDNRFRYFVVNDKKITDSEMTLILKEDTAIEAAFGTYSFSVTVFGKGAVGYEFIGLDEVVVTAFSGEGFFYDFEWNENVSFENPLNLAITSDTELLVNFKTEYIVIDISGGPSAEFYPISYLDDIPEEGWTEEYKTTKFVLRKIEAGDFTMGSPKNERGRYEEEIQHEVTIEKAFYIGVFETTQKQYELITGSNPSCFKGDARPVECVSYDMLRGNEKGAEWPISNDVDENSFFGRLRVKTGLSFDLPTEALWEYACRARTTTALNNGTNLSNTAEDENMNKLGRYMYNGGADKDDGGNIVAHAKVGSYLPNVWGLYDMHGNVLEWCLDWYTAYKGDAIDPMDDGDRQNRVLRGGAWRDYARDCRSAYRDYNYHGTEAYCIGFRLVLVQ